MARDSVRLSHRTREGDRRLGLAGAIDRARSALLPLNWAGHSRSAAENDGVLAPNRCSMGVRSSGAGFGVTEDSGRRIYEDDWASLAVSHLPGAFLDGRWCAGECRRIGRTIASQSRRKPCGRDGRRVRRFRWMDSSTQRGCMQYAVAGRLGGTCPGLRDGGG